jgi:hypothetical protein
LTAAILGGRWSVNMRRMENALSLITCGAMLWTVLDGPVFMADSSDSTVKFVMVVIVAITLINFGIKAFRRVRPKPGKGGRRKDDRLDLRGDMIRKIDPVKVSDL